jgi:Protein of unknown function (DUF1475)
MPTKSALITLFCAILLSMLAVSSWASMHQSMFVWGGLTGEPDRYWTIATVMDAYFGFLTFYVWVYYKEMRALPRLVWFFAIMMFGNMAMSLYALMQRARLRPDGSVADLLSMRNL